MLAQEMPSIPIPFLGTYLRISDKEKTPAGLAVSLPVVPQGPLRCQSPIALKLFALMRCIGLVAAAATSPAAATAAGSAAAA